MLMQKEIVAAGTQVCSDVSGTACVLEAFKNMAAVIVASDLLCSSVDSMNGGLVLDFANGRLICHVS